MAQPKNTVASIKRFMGLPFADSEREQRLVPYTVERGDKAGCVVNIMGKHYTPEEISAMVLTKMKGERRSLPGREGDRGGDHRAGLLQRRPAPQATKDAGAIAGLDVKRIINEPTAAALAYGLDKKKDGTIAVFDFGGRHLRHLHPGGFPEGVVEVKSTNGDTHLGGDNVDQILIDWLVEEFQKTEGIDLRKQADAMQRPEGSGREGQVRTEQHHPDRHQSALHHRRRQRAPSTSPRTSAGPSSRR